MAALYVAAYAKESTVIHQRLLNCWASRLLHKIAAHVQITRLSKGHHERALDQL